MTEAHRVDPETERQREELRQNLAKRFPPMENPPPFGLIWLWLAIVPSYLDEGTSAFDSASPLDQFLRERHNE